MTDEGMSALDWCLRSVTDVGDAPKNFAAARAELAALRERCADLEMMLRAAANRHPTLKAIFAPRMDGAAFTLRDLRLGTREPGGVIELKSDETGIPILIPAARKALGGDDA